MGYRDDLSEDQLIDLAFEKIDDMENLAQWAMRCLVEVKRRRAENPEQVPQDPEPPQKPEPIPKEPEPPATPTPGEWVRADSIEPVERDYNLADLLKPANQTHEVSLRELAAMRIDQPHVSISSVDPIFQMESSGHLHDWFNRGGIPSSGSYEDLIRSATRENTIGEGRQANSSIYGLGSLLVQDEDDRWHNVVARYSIFYYKRERLDHPDVHPGMLADLPRGLKMLGGIRHYRTPAEWQKTSSNPDSNAPTRFKMLQGTIGNPQQIEGAPEAYYRLDELLPFAEPGRHIQVNIEFPEWWDGIHIDSPNHVSHVSYYRTETHNRKLPSLSTHALYTLPDFPIKRIAVSADLDDNGVVKDFAGREAHGYYLEGLDDEVRRLLHRSVFDRGLDGNNGNLQNGTCLKWRDRSLDAPMISVPTDEVISAGGEYRVAGIPR